MLFNSYTFIFAFLPFTLIVYHALRAAGQERGAFLALTLASLFFYGWWNPLYLLLLIPLTVLNYAMGQAIMAQKGRRAKHLLILGLALNIGVLGYFKYANFLVDNVNALFGLDLFFAHVVLPLGISFFTFQKIAFLVDAYRGKVDRISVMDFALFVSFFPQLIAGPIVHHSEVLPQFRKQGSLPGAYIAMGMTMFTLGLAKKVLLADTAALYATPVFATAAAGNFVGFMAAWQAALAYTLQLYFDFSGYCDMAIGSALLFGIRLPVNFDSPYQATSIIDFWRRWHITLSRFLRDYVYIPLGGNRFGLSRRYGNVLLTMLIGGLWHGANWTFVIWGGLHGLYLIVNHTWRHMGCPNVGAWPSRVLTFIAVMVAWVFFRAADMPTALSLLQSMAGQHGAGTLPYEGVWLCAVLLLFAWFAPNTQELTGYTGPAGIYGEAKTQAAGHALRWQLSWHWAVATGCLFAVAMLSLSRISEFIYFQF